MRRVRDNETGECYYIDSMDLSSQSGEGIFDTIASVLGKAGSKVAQKGTEIASNKLAKKVGSLALEKAGEKIVNKILPPPIERIEKNLENKGSQIIEQLKKLQHKEKQTIEYKIDSSFSDQFDKLINM